LTVARPPQSFRLGRFDARDWRFDVMSWTGP